ncbi:hypothetical protein CNYM01_00211 [Colletotrichum nymphaeae SA-01]|uniref:C2H2-type domain-containing protein n=1 Tax=Colletotrichum nymphaeae SA-01 TaxID=1460502 RepID=A0A135U7F1_9PEZI|nr:hypothetical protein CNYM01_00211 [Colletotrichum nymphaeae SA-01]
MPHAINGVYVLDGQYGDVFSVLNMGSPQGGPRSEQSGEDAWNEAVTTYTNGNSNGELMCYYGYCGQRFDNRDALLDHEPDHDYAHVRYACTCGRCTEAFLGDPRAWRECEERHKEQDISSRISWICSQNVSPESSASSSNSAGSAASSSSVGENPPETVYCNRPFKWGERKDFWEHVSEDHQLPPTVGQIGWIFNIWWFPRDFEGSGVGFVITASR